MCVKVWESKLVVECVRVCVCVCVCSCVGGGGEISGVCEYNSDIE